MKRKAFAFGLALILGALILSGCGPGAADDLVGSEWVLLSLNDNGLIENTSITLSFEEKSLGGSAGCNSYSGGRDSGKYVATDEGLLTIPPLAVTEMFCSEPEGVMEQEEAYIRALHDAATYQVIEGRLEIAGANGQTTLVFAPKE
jgi:heat shock protein HslJ